MVAGTGFEPATSGFMSLVLGPSTGASLTDSDTVARRSRRRWHGGGGQTTAIDLAHGRGAQREDGHRDEDETRQGDHRSGAEPVGKTAGGEVAEGHHAPARPPVQRQHPAANVIGGGNLE